MKLVNCLFLFLLIYGCTQEEVSPRLYPRVKSINTSNVNVNGFSATGEITFSSVEILDHGFVWNAYLNPDFGFGKVVSLGAKDGVGTFTMEADTVLETGKVYYIRPFARSSDYVVYGDQMSFEVPN